MFLFFLGIIAIIGGIVFLVVKKKKAPAFITVGVGFLMVIIGIISVGNEFEDLQPEEQTEGTVTISPTQETKADDKSVTTETTLPTKAPDSGDPVVDDPSQGNSNTDVPNDITEAPVEIVRPEYKPVNDLEITGNFMDIDQSLFEGKHTSPSSIVGRWYEDGLKNGYCLEIYGDGTWQYFGPETVKGTYRIGGMPWLTDSFYGIEVMSLAPFWNDGTYLSVSVYTTDYIQVRTKSASVYFRPESESWYVDDIDKYYNELFPLYKYAGYWYPVGGTSEDMYYLIDAKMTFAQIEQGGGEGGPISEVGENSFVGHLMNEFDSEPLATIHFEDSGDGYLYIDGVAYERHAEVTGAIPPEAVGTFYYYNREIEDFTDDGYIFYDDGTFESVPEASFDERGTFIFINDDMLLYDEEGNQIHHFRQSEYDRYDKEIVDLSKDDYYAHLFRVE